MPIKLLSLAAAVVLWIFVVGIENSVYKFPEALDIQVINLEKNVSVSSDLPPVNVYIKDDKQVVASLTRNDFVLSLDLSGLKSGEHEIPVSVTARNPQVRIVKVEPGQVSVKLSPAAEKEVKISAEISGSPQSGFEAGDFKLEFEKAKILGAQTYLDRIDEVRAVLALNGSENQKISQNISLSLPAESTAPVGSITIVPSEVLVTLDIVPKLQQKKVPVTLKLGDITDQALWAGMITVTPSEVTLEGDEKTIQSVTAVETAILDVPQFIKQNASASLALELPAGIKVAGGASTVSVSLKKESVERKAVAAPVVLIGRASGFNVKSVSPPSVTVTVTGAATLINNLKEGAVTCTIDLSKVGKAGTLSISESNISLPPGFKIIEIKPDQITLK